MSNFKKVCYTGSHPLLVMPNSYQQYCATSQKWNIVSPAKGISKTKRGANLRLKCYRTYVVSKISRGQVK